MTDCENCSKTTQQWCTQHGCWKDQPEKTGWANPDDLKRDVEFFIHPERGLKSVKNFDRVVEWIGGEE